MRPKKRLDPPPLPSHGAGSAPHEDRKAAKPDDGGFQALDQIANWVRFADTKATILTASLGVVLTMLMTKSDAIAAAIAKGGGRASVVGGLAALAFFAFLWTSFWLLRAIAPQGKVPYAEPNRFAWPSLTRSTMDSLSAHADQVDVRTDAWGQVIDLSRLAERKFDACGKAVRGFALLVVLGLSCVVAAVAYTI